MLRHPTITIGDRAYFPLGPLGTASPVYRRTWEAIAFTLEGAVVVRRRHDGLTRTIASRYWDDYAIDPPLATPRSALGPLPLPRLQGDRARPGFYVSALSGRHPGRYLLLIGPFDSEANAQRWVQPARRHHAAHYDDPYCEVAIGTCRSDSGARDGVWNSLLLTEA